jgi:D-threo-aldose 1-dehydrogenase
VGAIVEAATNPAWKALVLCLLDAGLKRVQVDVLPAEANGLGALEASVEQAEYERFPGRIRGRLDDSAHFVNRERIGWRHFECRIDQAGRRILFDYSADGVARSLEESLERLGTDRIDLVFIHDPDDHWQSAIDGAYPALHRLREQGVVGAIGVGMNQSAQLVRFAREAELDAFLVAGRYTLLDQDALPQLLPLCVERGISVLIGGVMNSGVLADPRKGAHFDYGPAGEETLDRAQRLAAICERHGVPLKAAAVQFPLAHPAVAGLIAGVRSVEHLDEYPALMRRPIPAALWQELRAGGLIAADAPTPP